MGRPYQVLTSYYFVILISFLLSIFPSVILPVKLYPHHLRLYLVTNIIIANFIVFILIYFIENVVKFSIILIPWLFFSSLLEFYIGMSAILRDISQGYFTVLLIFLEFYGMLYFSEKKEVISWINLFDKLSFYRNFSL